MIIRGKYYKQQMSTLEANLVEKANNQSKISFAIAELEKLKEFVEKEIKKCSKLILDEFEDDYYIQSVGARQSMCYEFRGEIGNQIKKLKGE